MKNRHTRFDFLIGTPPPAWGRWNVKVDPNTFVRNTPTSVGKMQAKEAMDEGVKRNTPTSVGKILLY